MSRVIKVQETWNTAAIVEGAATAAFAAGLFAAECFSEARRVDMDSLIALLADERQVSSEFRLADGIRTYRVTSLGGNRWRVDYRFRDTEES